MVNFSLGRQVASSLFSKNSTCWKRGVLPQLSEKRQIWGWLNSIFNRYDDSRVKEVGPDRACAEWLIRCGAGVKWEKDGDWFKDYNALPVTYDRNMKIYEVDATDSAVMYIGFKHFQGLTKCRKMIFHKSGYFEDMCIKELSLYSSSTLKELQISSCGNVTSEGILMLRTFKPLEKLLLYDFPQVKNREECIKELKQALPNCEVRFPYALASERTQQHLDELKALESKEKAK